MTPDSNDIPFNTYSIDFFGALFDSSFGNGSGDGLRSQVAEWINFFITLWGVFTVLSFLFSILLLFGIIYAYMRESQLGAAVDDFIAQHEAAYRNLYGARTKNWRWQEVENHIGGENPNDWKLAIIEADVLLKETLDAKGYVGPTIADQLKSISPQQVQSLDAAWEAHKVRNKVAHSGTDFVLTKRLAQETVAQYKQVFDEFGVL